MTLNAVKVKDDFKLGFNPTSRLTLAPVFTLTCTSTGGPASTVSGPGGEMAQCSVITTPTLSFLK